MTPNAIDQDIIDAHTASSVQIRIEEAPLDNLADVASAIEAIAMDHLKVPTSEAASSRRLSITSSEASNDTWSSIYDISHAQYKVSERPQKLWRSASAWGSKSLGLHRVATLGSRMDLSAINSLFATKKAASIQEAKRKRRSEAIMAKRSSLIVLFFLMIWLPLPILVGYCSTAHDIHLTLEAIQKYFDLHVSAVCFGTLSAATNPIVYALAIKSFRKSLSQLMRGYRRKFCL